MKTSTGFRFAAAFGAVLSAFAASCSLFAEEAMEPIVGAGGLLQDMAGTGGVLRDAERRVMAPAKVTVDKPAPAVTGVKRPDGIPAASYDVLIGPIAAIKINGSKEFAEREGLAEKVLAELGEGDKSLGDVSAAIAKVRDDLMKRGLYLVRISVAREGTYDTDTKTLALLVDEGRFGKLTISFDDDGEKSEDGFWFSRSQIESKFRAIEEGDTFDYSRLRGVLFDANAHPDLTIDTAIDVRKPIEGEGEDRRIARYADVSLDVRESIPFHAVWEINNYGMEEINEWQTSLTLQYLNLTKHDDVLTFSPSMSLGAEMYSVAGSYMLPHDYLLGGMTTLYGGYSYLDVSDIVPRLNLEGSGYFGGLQHTENIYNSDRHLLAISAGVMWRYIEDQYTALGYSLNERGTSILPLSLALSYTEKKADFLGGRNFATIQGVYNVFNGDDDLEEMWTGAEENYTIFRGQVARLQPIFGWYNPETMSELHQWILFVKVEGQYTSDTLIPVEKLALGGHNCLRGYSTRGYLGDYGVYGTVELRTPILVDTFASLFGDRTNKTPIDRLQFLGFCDWGITQYKDLPAGADDNEFLTSVGVGARFALTQYSQVRCDFAFPITDGNNDNDEDFELYVGVQLQY